MTAPGFDAAYGLEVLEHSADEIRARVAVREHHKQPFGLVHGGLYAAMAEGMACLATGAVVRDDGKLARGLATHTNFLRPVLGGTIHAVARRRHRGRTTWLWEVEMTDDDGRLCALVRATIAVRDAPAD